MAQGILHARETPDAVNSAPNPEEAGPIAPDSPRLEVPEEPKGAGPQPAGQDPARARRGPAWPGP